MNDLKVQHVVQTATPWFYNPAPQRYASASQAHLPLQSPELHVYPPYSDLPLLAGQCPSNATGAPIEVPRQHGSG